MHNLISVGILWAIKFMEIKGVPQKGQLKNIPHKKYVRGEKMLARQKRQYIYPWGMQLASYLSVCKWHFHKLEQAAKISCINVNATKVVRKAVAQILGKLIWWKGKIATEKWKHCYGPNVQPMKFPKCVKLKLFGK